MYWIASLLIFFHYFGSYHWSHRVVLWGWGLRTDRVYISLSLALPTFFNNNNHLTYFTALPGLPYGITKCCRAWLCRSALGLSTSPGDVVSTLHSSDWQVPWMQPMPCPRHWSVWVHSDPSPTHTLGTSISLFSHPYNSGTKGSIRYCKNHKINKWNTSELVSELQRHYINLVIPNSKIPQPCTACVPSPSVMYCMCSLTVCQVLHVFPHHPPCTARVPSPSAMNRMYMPSPSAMYCMCSLTLCHVLHVFPHPPPCTACTSRSTATRVAVPANGTACHPLVDWPWPSCWALVEASPPARRRSLLPSEGAERPGRPDPSGRESQRLAGLWQIDNGSQM